MNLFTIDIGSRHSGHQQHRSILIKSNKPFDLVKKAYKKAYFEQNDAICPENMCHEYQDRSISPEAWEKIKKAGITSKDLGVDEEGFGWFEEKLKMSFEDPEMFAYYILWFIKLGDPELELEMLEPPRLDGSFGYGFFGG